MQKFENAALLLSCGRQNRNFLKTLTSFLTLIFNQHGEHVELPIYQCFRSFLTLYIRSLLLVEVPPHIICPNIIIRFAFLIGFLLSFCCLRHVCFVKYFKVAAYFCNYKYSICACSLTDFYVLISSSRLRVDAKSDSETFTCGRGIL